MKKPATEMVARLAQELRSEVVMLAAQTTAGCAAYAHYISDTLQRFLSAGDDCWFEIYGEPEPWESDLFSKEFEWRYVLGGDSPLHDGVLARIAAYYGLPGIADARAVWQIDRGLMDGIRNA